MESSSQPFSGRSSHEGTYSPESSQVVYVQELTTHALRIPDFTKVTQFHSFDDEQRQIISRYCQDASYMRSGAKAQVPDAEPLYRSDILEPDWMRGVRDISAKAAGEDSTHNHWYKPFTPRPKQTDPYRYVPQDDPRVVYASKRWEIAYITYVRERHAFHANFMAALINGADITPLVDAIEKPHYMPAPDINKGGDVAVPDLFSKTNWLLGGMLSALALPPEQCDGAMKRRAIELFAQHYDPKDVAAFEQFYNLKRPNTQRLPWEMRKDYQMMSAIQRYWQANPSIHQYFTPQGMEQLLHDNPKAYLQFIILDIFSDTGCFKDTLRRYALNLVSVTEMSPAVQDIIFAEDAAHNTVYSPVPVLPGLDEPRTLTDLLEAKPVEDVDWQELAGKQRLRIHDLEQKLTAAQAEKQAADKRAQDLGSRVLQLESTIRNHVCVQQATSPNNLFAKHGLDPKISDELLLVVVTALRRQHNKTLRTDSGHVDGASIDPQTAAANAERLKQINAELDTILKLRGLEKNRRN